MFKESILDKVLYRVKKLIPKKLFNFAQPIYHILLAYAGAVLYGFPSKSMKVIGVTGTKGKSTVVHLISRLLEGSGHKVAAVGSLGFKILNKEWPNNLKMTMPGRMKLQKFLSEAKKAGCEYVVMEVTSEGIKQKRHLGIDFDCAVLTNLHKEHIERHGSFENYYAAKQELFRNTHNLHVLNADDPHLDKFSEFPASKKIFYGLNGGDIRGKVTKMEIDQAEFHVYGIGFQLNLGGEFNIYNALAALSTVAMYGVDLPTAKPILGKINSISGRMEFLQREPFVVIVDYAHTPDSLEAVYKNLKSKISNLKSKPKLIAVLGAAGGGRDKWKRPEFGRIASEYCDEIILTNEDPYDEDPEKIIDDILVGIKDKNYTKIVDRREAIKHAIKDAKPGDIVVITGKGSETSMALGGGEKIPWSDKKVAENYL